MAKTHQGTSAEAAAEMRRDADAAAAADADASASDSSPDVSSLLASHSLSSAPFFVSSRL